MYLTPRLFSSVVLLNPRVVQPKLANRMPSLSYNRNYASTPWALTDIDLVTGADRTIHYNSDGQPTDAVAGSPEYFRNMGEQFVYSALGRQAIAPLWEVQTAKLQSDAGDPQAGLTEVQRAQRNSQLASALITGATTQTWRPIVLDLNGDGVQTIAKGQGPGQANIAFDIDGSGFYKNTAWVSKQDGFLVLDRNFNGFVDDASEIFSNSAVADSAKGIASLRWVDANGDGDISGFDPVELDITGSNYLAGTTSKRYKKSSCLRPYLLGWGAKRPIKQLQRCSKRATGGRRNAFDTRKLAYLAMKNGVSPISTGESSYERSSKKNSKLECAHIKPNEGS